MAAAFFKIESGVQLLARLTKKPEIENFYPSLFKCGLNHGNTVEIFSNISTSHLLTDIISEALFPNKTNDDPIGVLMFNTAGNFKYEHLIETLQKRIYLSLDNKLNSDMQKSEINRILYETLDNFFLLEIYDATQFYTTIHNLDSIFMKHSNISLLIFDTLTAFYWSEQGFKITKMDLYIKNLLRMIQNISKEYKVILVYTRPGYFSSSKDIDYHYHKTSEISEGLSFKVQLVDNSDGDYQVNVKSSDTYFMKSYKIVDNLIKWQ